MKKFLSIVLAVTLGITATSCGEKPAENTGSGTTEAGTGTETTEASDKPYEGTEIRVLTHMGNLILGDEVEDANGNTYRDEKTAWMKIAAEKFTEETGIIVQFEQFKDMASIKSLMQVGDSSFDVMTIGSTADFLNEEAVRYLEPLMTQDEARAIYDDAIIDGFDLTIDGQLYGWPMSTQYDLGIAYNEEVIKSVGYDAIPDDFAEFEEMMRKLRDAGITPISLHRTENWPLMNLEGFASYVDGKPNSFSYMLQSDAPFNKDGSSIGYVVDMYTRWKSEKFFEQEMYTGFGAAMDSVANGDAAMMLFGSWVVPQVQARTDNPESIKFDLYPDLGMGRGITKTTQFMMVQNVASKNKEASALFLDYLSKQADFFEKTGGICGREDVTPIIPASYKLVDSKIEAGGVLVITPEPKDENYYATETILKETDLLADVKWAGLPFDALDITKPDDWSGYNKQIETQNKMFKEYQEKLGYTFQE